MKKVVVASKNPVKIECTKYGFEKAFPDQDFSFEGVSVESGVSDQPMTDADTLRGAQNRAQNALKLDKDAFYGVGIEGGLDDMDGVLACFAWIVIVDKNGKMGKGKSGTFFLPEKVASLVRQGKELGEADDIVFKRENSKQQNGAVGILTNDIVTRNTLYQDAVVFALIPFLNKELY